MLKEIGTRAGLRFQSSAELSRAIGYTNLTKAQFHRFLATRLQFDVRYVLQIQPPPPHNSYP